MGFTGLPGAGVTSVARLMCSEFGALPMSMASHPRMRLEAELGVKGYSAEAGQLLARYRIERERAEPLCWIRPFHRRLMRTVRMSRPSRLVITGILTRKELFYCKAMGARLIHLAAPETVRRQRIGLRFPTEPTPAQTTLNKLVHVEPGIWDLIIDTDEPYPEFVHSIRLLLARF
ncbi:MAG: hypothetical protein V3T00_00810 [bacterium]